GCASLGSCLSGPRCRPLSITASASKRRLDAGGRDSVIVLRGCRQLLDSLSGSAVSDLSLMARRALYTDAGAWHGTERSKWNPGLQEDSSVIWKRIEAGHLKPGDAVD